MHCHRYSGVRASTARIPSSPVFHRPIDSPCPTSRYINWSHWQKHGIADIDVWVSIERWLCIDQCTANCADMVIGYSNHMTRASGCVWSHVNALGHASRAGGIRLALAEILREYVELSKSSYDPRAGMEEPNNDIDTETLQAQIDLSMAYAQNLIASWLPTSGPMSLSSSRTGAAEAELQALLRRPPR